MGLGRTEISILQMTVYKNTLSNMKGFLFQNLFENPS